MRERRKFLGEHQDVCRVVIRFSDGGNSLSWVFTGMSIFTWDHTEAERGVRGEGEGEKDKQQAAGCRKEIADS